MGVPVWSHRLVSLLLYSGLVQALSFAVRPNLSYAAIDAGGSAAILGVIAATMAVPALFLALPAGRFIDNYGERPAMMVGSALLICSCVIAVLAETVFVLLLATVVFGVGHLLTVVGSQVMTGNLADGRNLDARFGLYTLAGTLGQTVGPLVLLLPGGSAIAPPTTLVFIVCTAVSAVVLVLSSMLRSSSSTRPVPRPEKMISVASSLLRKQGLPQALFASAIVLASIDLFIAYLPALGQDQGLSTQMVAIMLTVRSLMAVVSRIFLTRLLVTMGRRNLLVSSITVAALMLVCLIIPLPTWGYLVLAAIYGFAVGPCQPVTMAWVTELAPPTDRGMAMSLRLASNRLAQAALPASLGAFATATGAGGVLAVTGLVLGAAAYASRSASPGRGG